MFFILFGSGSTGKYEYRVYAEAQMDIIPTLPNYVMEIYVQILNSGWWGVFGAVYTFWEINVKSTNSLFLVFKFY